MRGPAVIRTAGNTRASTWTGHRAAISKYETQLMKIDVEGHRHAARPCRSSATKPNGSQIYELDLTLHPFIRIWHIFQAAR